MKSLENIVFALHDFDAVNPEDLPLKRGEQILVLKKDEGFNDGWWEGQNIEGKKGLFPVIYTMSYSELSKVLSVDPFLLKNSLMTVKENKLAESTITNIDNLLSYIGHNGFKNMTLEDPNDDVLSWTPKQVASWIKSKGFGSVANKFIEHEVTGEILLHMDYIHLKELDIISFGKRFEIEREIKLLRDSLSINIEKTQQESLKDDVQTSSQSIIKNFDSDEPNYHQSVSTIDHSLINQKSFENNISHTNSLSLDQIYNLSSNGTQVNKTNSIVSKSSIDKSISTIYEYKNGIMNGSEYSEATKLDSKSLENSINIKSPWKATNKLIRTSKRKHKTSITSSRLQKNDKTSEYRKSLRLSKHMNQDVLKACPYGNYSKMDTITTLKEIQSFNTDSSKTFKVEKGVTKAPSKRLGKISITKRSLLKRDQKIPTGIKEGIRYISVQDAIKEADYYGWMRKKTDRYGQWKLRFFCLTGTRLSYFYSEDEIGEKGLIDINSHRVVSMNNRFSYGEGKFCFKIIPPAPGTAKGITFTSPKVHYFATDNLEDMKGWVRAFIKITIGRDESMPVLSSCKIPTISLKAAKEKMKNISIDNSPKLEYLSKDDFDKVSSQEHSTSSKSIQVCSNEDLLENTTRTDNNSSVSDIKSSLDVSNF